VRNLPRPDRPRSPGRNCEVCHKRSTTGRFKQGRECASCHFNTSWAPSSKVRHNRQTPLFPLGGKHETVDCRACHRGKGPADYENFEKL